MIGVQADRLLVASPRPRNPALADAFKRIGLVERTGRGVSIIYLGQLRNGRPAPRYDRSTDVSVTVVLDSALADLDFVLLTIGANQASGRAPGVDELLTLWQIQRKGAVNAHTLAPLLQREPDHAADVLKTLSTAGLLRADGQAYRLNSQAKAQGRTNSLPPDPELVVLDYIQTHGSISRREVVDLCGLSENQAGYLLKRLVERGELHLVGQGRSARYKLGKTRKRGKELCANL